jgi:hypothetical protein
VNFQDHVDAARGCDCSRKGCTAGWRVGPPREQWRPVGPSRAERKARKRRERIATAVLAGLSAWPGDTQHCITHADRAAFAVCGADALIAELDK